MTDKKSPTKSEVTRLSIMRAAEKLFAKHGKENVTVRAIIEASGQKNESALQYHFKNRQGLVDAINHFRQGQIDSKRGELLNDILQNNPEPSVREICEIMVKPVFILAKSDSAFRQWLKSSTLDHAAATTSTIKRNWASLGENTWRAARLLYKSLSHIDQTVFDLRLMSVNRYIALTLSIQAKEKNAFRGPNSALFYSVFLDGVVALFNHEVSHETIKLLQDESSND